MSLADSEAMQNVDLSSDTSTRPTPEMRRAIADAEVGDEQRRLDPTTNRLQERVAALLGQEEALLLPSGTMCNLIGVAAHTRRGDSVIAHRLAHVIRFEASGAAVVSGVLVDQVDGPRGQFDGATLEAALAPGSPYFTRTRLVCLEQTCNLGGGSVWPLERWDEVVAVAKGFGAAVHVDGARLGNAAVASGVAADRWGAGVDSIWLDFTKGLGAPMGAVLAGSAAFIEEARRYKHLLGGAMRQSGMAAAGCLWALDHHWDRLAEDHQRAERLAAGWAEVGLVPAEEPETNLVFVDPSPVGLTPAALTAGLAEVGVTVVPIGAQVRAVTHLDVDDAGIEAAIAAAHRVVSRR